MWENQYDNILTRESIIVPELACDLNYMPWFRIHGKPYFLSKKKRHQQICVEREQRSHLNPRIIDGEAGPSTELTQSPTPTKQVTMPTPQPLQIMSGVYVNLYIYHFPTFIQGWNVWPDASHFLITPSQPMIYKPSSQEGPYEAPLGSSTYFQTPSLYKIQAGYVH
ncbi:hypothetical protein PVK06_028050 [Gossypium arboreum]|uniref:Uncharacterized protein n=1 Tax=Gossypium arboreum TaxID=29729 RepID=A0ABR0P1V5_GOSAR|nr:hypothetical protein PVK06_028050 [Gossypium arboreum]